MVRHVKAILAIQDPSAILGAKKMALVVSREGAEVRRVPIGHVSEVHLFGAIEVTARARELLLREGVDVVCMTRAGSYLGRWLGVESRWSERRLAQYQRLSDPVFALDLARRVVLGKMNNQRAWCQRIAREREIEEVSAAVVAIRALERSVARAQATDELMGVEGRASVLYYRSLGRALRHPEIEFKRRTRRPPRDPVNACLSFGYTLLLSKVVAAIHRAGLDPHLGALHQAGRGKPALALDLMEGWRPLVDRMVWRLFNRKQLGLGDFETPESWAEEEPSVDVLPTSGIEVAAQGDGEPPPPVYMAASGRAVFLTEWGALWRHRQEYAPRNAKFELGQILDLEVQWVSRCLEGGTLEWEPCLLIG